MSNVYFIGGAPRSGKTTTIQRLIENKPMLAASTDAIRSVAKGMINPEANPRLFKTERGAFSSTENVKAFTQNPEKVLGYELGESEETWKSVLNFVSYYQRDGKDAAIEGVAVLPKNMANLNFQYKVVFVVCLEDQTEIMLDRAHNDRHEWLSKYTDEVIRAFCSFNIRLNQYYYDEAKNRDLPYILVRSKHFEDDINKAVEILLTD